MRPNYEKISVKNTDGTFTSYLQDPAGNKIEELEFTTDNKISAGSKLGMAIKKFDFDKYEETHDVTPKSQAEPDPYKGLSGLDRIIAQCKDNDKYEVDYINDWEIHKIGSAWASDLKMKIGAIQYSVKIDFDTKTLIISNINNQFGDNLTDVHLRKLMSKIDIIQEKATYFYKTLEEQMAEIPSYDHGKVIPKIRKEMGEIHRKKSDSSKLRLWNFHNYQIIVEVSI